MKKQCKLSKNTQRQWIALKTLDLGQCTFLCIVYPFKHTLFEIFIFCPKIQLWYPDKIVDFLGLKTREIILVLDFLAVDNFDFTRKIVKKILGE